MILLPFLIVAGLALLECSASPTPQIEDFEINNLGKIQKGEELFESDIILTAEQWEAVRQRKAINNEGSRWPEGSDGYPLVPYLFFDTSVNRDAVKAGINHWMEHTCIKFDETTNENQAHIQFYKGHGCNSLVGVSSPIGQKLSIGGGCHKLRSVVHEIGHAMGFWHEQNRSDRDDYISIKWDNMNYNKQRAFRKRDTNNYDVKYDYGSRMHYSSWFFSKNGKMTIVAKDPFAQEILESRAEGLSHRDKLLANKMYKCIDKWASKCGMAADSCKNEGYLGANCACVCPPGTSGDKCETVSSDYYAHLRSEHTETITTEKTFSHVRDAKFTKKIVAPECKLVKLTFTNFDLYKKRTKKGLTYCHYEYIFLRSGKDLTEGGIYCEKDIAAGQSFTSETDTMVLFSQSKDSVKSDGWTAKVEFVEDPRCTPGYTTPTPTTTEPTPAILVPCREDPWTRKVFAGDSIEIQSPNYPNNYPAIKCGWKLLGFGIDKVKLSCSNFRMEAPNEKGRCRDYLKIGTEKFCGDNGPVVVTISVLNTAKLSFKSNKIFEGGFSCTATAISE